MTDDEMDLFSTPDCPQCRSARDYLSSKGVRFREHDVSRDQDALRQMLALSGRASVPTIKAGNEVLVGFDRPRLDQMIERIKRAGAPE
jgi:glutaredoxin 3